MKNNMVDNLSLVLQALGLQILFRDYNNTDLMQELQKQDENYFEKMLANQEEMLSILRRKETDYERGNKRKNQ